MPETKKTEGVGGLTRKKKVVFVALVLFFFIVIAELITRFALNNSNAISIAERKNTFEPYQNKPWTEQYFKDEEKCNEQRREPTSTSTFVRYILYDVGYPECKTQTINWGGSARKTWNPDYDQKKPGIKVYKIGFFGGSTTQGAGVPDDLTIPSQFSKLINNATSNVVYQVENYGFSGYTYTQAVMKLVLLLREGKKFDFVVFYNGANDVDNAYEAGSVGALYAEKTVENRLDGGLWGQLKEAAKNQIGSCGLCRLVITFSRNTPFFRDHLTPLLVQIRKLSLFKEGASKSDEDVSPFAQGIADYYGKSHGFLDKLSRAYNFQFADFWQPSLLYEDGPVGGEKIYWDIDNRLTDEKLKKLYRETLADVVAMKLNNFYDLSHALVGRKKAYYLDAVHISDDGNEAVAERMFEAVKAALPQ